MILFKESLSNILTKLNGKYIVPEFLDKKHFPSLDGWRAVAILMVIINHVSLSIPSEYQYLKSAFGKISGKIGVDIFLVLSGFLITSLLIREFIKNGKINIKLFFIRRFLRISPPFYLYLFIILCLNPIFELHLNLENILVAIFYISNFVDITRNSWLTVHTWSLSLEEQFYLIWPFIFSHIKKSYQICALIILLMPVIRVVYYFYPNHSNFYLYPFINRGASIFTGALFAILSHKGIKIKTNIYLALLSFLIIGYVNYYETHYISGIFLYPFGYFFCNLSIAYLLLFSLKQKDNLLFYLMNSRVLVQLGLLSYSLYLWQQLFIFPEGKFPLLEKYSFFPVNILLAIGVAYLSYTFCERPIAKIKAKFSK